MRVIVAGSRSISSYSVIKDAIEESKFEITEIISGTARGVDSLGEQYAQENNIKLTKFPANWNKFGNSAGPIRNEEMAKNADALVAIWDGSSPGTRNMIDVAKRKNLKIFIKLWNVRCPE